MKLFLGFCIGAAEAGEDSALACAPEGWVDTYNHDCQYYKDSGLCPYASDYEAQANDGYHAIHCKECNDDCVGAEAPAVVSQMNGVIEYLWMDPNAFDPGYPANADMEWQIDAACDEVRVISTHLLTENDSDFVFVDEKRYSDDAEIDQIVPKSSFKVRFTSDSSYNMDGFRLEWSCPEEPVVPEPVVPEPVVPQMNGVIEYLWMDPNAFDPGYPANADMEWQIDAACDEVRVISTHLLTENDSDFVFVDEKRYSDDAEIDQIVPKSTFKVRFTSDSSYNMDGFRLEWSCPEEPASETFPCPSTECWTYDATTHTCSMKKDSDTCASLSCGATGFDITFESELFNLDANQSPVTLVGGLSPAWDGSQWSINAPLGESGMSYEIDTDSNSIEFKLQVAMIGSEMKKRSDDVEDNVISLGSKSVITTPFGASVVFACTYQLTIDVTEQTFSVSGASVVDTFSGTGSLDAGFVMTLNNGEPTAFLLGANLPVAITWSVSGLPSLTFNLQQCTVTHGSAIIPIVKGGCFASVLDVVPTATKQGFAYQVFKGQGQTDADQTIECTISICKVDECQAPTTCPTAGDDQFFGYQI